MTSPQTPEAGTTKIYRGFLREYNNGESDDILTITGLNPITALAEVIQDDMATHGHYLSVRYFIGDQERTEEELTLQLLKTLYGGAKADYGNRYSDLTGYLWTDEEIKVGGHDLLEELKGSIGKFCHLEITYHKSPR